MKPQRKDPALAEIKNDQGKRAIDLACLDCRRAMEKARMFLGRYEIADGPPEHRSATSLVVRRSPGPLWKLMPYLLRPGPRPKLPTAPPLRRLPFLKSSPP